MFEKLEVNKYLITKDLGRKGYNLVKMLKLVLFCQMERIYSLRAMEKAARNDIRIMLLTDEIKPSHKTIGDFINNNLSQSINEIFLDLNKYLIKEEKIDTSKLYIDGTKIDSRSNKYKFVWKKLIKDLKQDYGIRRFRRYGLKNITLEFTLIAIGYNLSKFHNNRYKIAN